MFSHTITRTYNDAVSNIGSTESVAADTAINFDGAVSAPTTDGEIDWAVTQANLKSLCLYSDKALTIKTNATGESAQDTITLAAGQALVWSLAHDGLPACPFSGDVTKLYVTLGGTATAALKVRALCDQTP